MFLVLVEYVDEGIREWKVCNHGPYGVRTDFPTREEAEDFAMVRAAVNPNRYAVVEITECYARTVLPEKIAVGPHPVN